MTTEVARRISDRRVPPLGGFNVTFVGLEVRRLLRNRRTTIFTLIVPVAFYFLFRNGTTTVKSIGGVSIHAYAMVSLAVYGAMVAATAGGAMVSVERAVGWSRQLRLTPLRPYAYMAIKVLTAMVLGLMSVVVVFAAGALTGVHMSVTTWIFCGLLAWGGALVFAAFGLFMGYLLPSENVMQILGPILGAFAFFGGILVPLAELGPGLRTIARYAPTYGIGQLARSPLIGSGLTASAVANALAWTAVFVIGAAFLFRRDTQRV
jgi:ABC-2 type transport system permease protein